MRAYCCQHHSENVKKNFGVGAKDLFWKLERSSHLPQFPEHMHTLATQKPKAAAYIEKIGLELFSSAHFPGRRYTHDTSNIVECMNSIYLEEREQPVLIMLNGIWHKEMSRHYERYEKAQAWLLHGGSLLTDFGTEKLKEAIKFARQYTIQVSSTDDALVTRAINGARAYTVNLESRKFTCLHSFDTDIPCVHAIAIIYCLGKAPINYMPSYCRVETFNEAYKINLPVASIELLSLQQDANETGRIESAERAPDPELLVEVTEQKTTNNDTTGQEIPGPGRRHPPHVSMEAPVTRVPRGRPAKKRKRLGDHRSGIPSIGEEIMSKAPPRCSTCGKVGHYARTCQQSHI